MKPFIVFEGPDMCGKTSHIDTVVEMLRERGLNYKAVKFPVYGGFKGEDILDHLKSFDIYDNDIQTSFMTLMNHATNLYVNKVAALEELKKESENYDGFIVDRFDISQFVYDVAWIDILYRINGTYIIRGYGDRIFKSMLQDFFDKAVDRSLSTHELYKNFFNIKYIVFEPSHIIKDLSKRDSDRRYDKYDANEKYQYAVSRMTSIVSKFEKPHLTSLKSELNRCIKKADLNFLVFKETISKNVLATIDTDEYYETVSKCKDICLSEKIDEVVSKYKSDVTSIIDKVIVDSITSHIK